MKLFDTVKTENLSQKFKRFAFNLYPPYFISGAKVRFLSADWKEAHVSIKLKLRNRNYVGVVFGGSIFSAADPISMLQLLHILDESYIVWDKSAEIIYKKPIKKKVSALFLITDSILENIKEKVAKNGEFNLELPIDFVDKNNIIHARVSKVLYIANKDFFKQKQLAKN
jgi:acyl-coenzyme A thioesterase PaaI-like protein